MPEGDTIYKTAETLHRVLAGKAVVRFSSRVPGITRWDTEELEGAMVNRVEPRGKNLLIHFSTDLVLHTHLRMRGRWHVYRPGEKWRMSERAVRVAIQVADFVAVCFDAPVVRLVRSADLESETRFRRLGPDPLQQVDLDVAAVRRELQKRGDLLIGDALLCQQVLAGVGNVFKCEILFVESVSPFVTVKNLDERRLEDLIRTAISLMRQNRGRGPRRTRNSLQGQSLWVYGRSGRPCFRCGTTIKAISHGRHFRVTFYCPRCQKVD
jgi:endonuclease-8